MISVPFQVEHLKKVLAGLGSPHETLPVISVAGTNGKGSISAYLSSILSRSGYKTGLYTSPHVFNFRERIQLDSTPISYRDFKMLLKQIRRSEKNNSCKLSRFEIMTAAAILYFKENNCDIGIMEAGLGGTYDATTVCTIQKLCVFSSISLDHMDYLGESLREIAVDKAGLIKDPEAVIDNSSTVYIEEICRKNAIRTLKLGRDYLTEGAEILEDGRYTCNYKDKLITISNIVPGMRGKYQVGNMAAAVKAALELGVDDTECIRHAVRDVQQPGRLEIYRLKDDIDVIIDAAHNPDAVYKLVRFLENYNKEKKNIRMIMGVYKDKDYKKMINIIKGSVDYACFIGLGSERSLSPVELKRHFPKDSSVAADFDTAFSDLLNMSSTGDIILACGSFRIVSPALTALK